MPRPSAPPLPSTGTVKDWIFDVYDFHINRLPKNGEETAVRILETTKINAGFYAKSRKIYAIAEDVAIGILDLPDQERSLLDKSLLEKYDFSFHVFLRKTIELASRIQSGDRITSTRQFQALREIVDPGALGDETAKACKAAMEEFEAGKRLNRKRKTSGAADI